ncbi:hypothetical protein B0H10DRAFT_1956508 [Mycena sp. CBHHK59/15]|nr:hypothetical protein B0H10DRAFT_1956508 [Mycena sp. CBHHK59/15]
MAGTSPQKRKSTRPGCGSSSTKKQCGTAGKGKAPDTGGTAGTSSTGGAAATAGAASGHRMMMETKKEVRAGVTVASSSGRQNNGLVVQGMGCMGEVESQQKVPGKS